MATADYGNPGGADDAITLVREVYASFARRDLAGLTGLIDAGFALDAGGTARLTGRTEPYIGASGLAEYFSDVAQVWEALDLHADDVRAVAGSVVVFGSVTGRTGGVDVRRRALWTFKLSHGRVASLRAADLGPL